MEACLTIKEAAVIEKLSVQRIFSPEIYQKTLILQEFTISFLVWGSGYLMYGTAGSANYKKNLNLQETTVFFGEAMGEN